MKTADLIGHPLDWAVAKALGLDVALITHANGTQPVIPAGNSFNYAGYSSLWDQGGPIIEREEIGIKRRAPSMPGEGWEAMGSITARGAGYRWSVGPTPLIAAMRCFVASKLGDEVGIPKELL